MAHARTITQEDVESPRPVYAVWEITMRCDHACAHCGSRAAVARPDELSREELLDVAGQLIRIGSREVTLIGGEAYLRPEIFEITRSANHSRASSETDSSVRPASGPAAASTQARRSRTPILYRR